MKTNELKVNQMEQVTGGNEIDVLKEIIMELVGVIISDGKHVEFFISPNTHQLL